MLNAARFACIMARLRPTRDQLHQLFVALECNPGETEQCFGAWRQQVGVAPEQECSLCKVTYATRHHYQSNRHLSRVASGGEYCAGCTRQELKRVTELPAPRSHLALDWRHVKRYRGTLVCTRCGGEIYAPTDIIDLTSDSETEIDPEQVLLAYD